MKTIYSFLAPAALLPLLFTACQKDGADTTPAPGAACTVEAAIDNGPHSRAQVQYGTQDAADGELFMWNAGDTFTLYDFTDLTASEFPENVFTISPDYDESQPGVTAAFSCEGFTPAANHRYLAVYNAALDVVRLTLVPPIRCKMTTTDMSAYTQVQTGNADNAAISHLKKGLVMYTFVDADGAGNLPALQFKHLTSLFRFSLTNNTGSDVKIEHVECTSSDYYFALQNSYSDLRFGFDMDSKTARISSFRSSPIYRFYFKDPAENDYATIANGETYELYAPCIPDITESFVQDDKLQIYFSTPDYYYSTAAELPLAEIAAANNGVNHFEWGKRYWFDLTIGGSGNNLTLDWTHPR